jgi:CDP-glycerol glycerophosphotransferase
MHKSDWVKKEYLKRIMIDGVRVAIRVFYFLPIRENRIVFFSFTGNQYSCNPKAISDYILRKAKGKYEIIWAFKDPEKFSYLRKEGIRIVKYNSLERILLQTTAKYTVNNTGAYSWIPVRKNQIHVNTWHAGGAYKRLQSDEHASYNRHLTAKETTHMLSSCEAFTKYNIREQFGYNGKVLEIGMPRNDVFFDRAEADRRSKEVRSRYGIPGDSFIVLYAPTWRYDGIIPQPDFTGLARAVEGRFGKKAVIAVRNHNYSKKEYRDVVDVTSYPDMQDLLCAADMLITDYSSSIWDYSFTYKPCFLYVEDLDKYTQEQGFFVDIHQWGFELCRNNEELAKAIKSYDADRHRKMMEKHHSDFGSFENGRAAERFCAEILKV